MKPILSIFIFALVAMLPACKSPPSPPARLDGTTIGVNHAAFYWKTKSDFMRASEFFTDKENTGTDLVMRTQPEVRDGLYLVIGVEWLETIPQGAIAKLEYFRPDVKGKIEKSWTLPEFYGKPQSEIRLGLTGSDWKPEDRKIRPNVWRLTITAPDGTLLISRKSFLWELPEN